MKRTLVIGLLVTILITALAGTAAADPEGEPLYLTCTNGIPGGWIVSPPPDADWTPGLQIGGTGVYIPYAFEFTAWFYPDEGNPVFLGTDGYSKRAPKNTKSHLHGECTFSGSGYDPESPWGPGWFEFSGSAWVFWTGK